MDDFLAIFDSPWVLLFLGTFFLWAGWIRGRRRPPGSITAGAGKIVFGIIGGLLLVDALYLMLRG